MSIGTLIFVVLALVLPLYFKYKKTLAEVEEDGAFVDADDESFFSVEDQEYEEEPEENDAYPYFTYEKESPAPVQKPRASEPRAEKTAAMVVEQDEPRFDLRQAVISKVILDNKYIGEIN